MLGTAEAGRPASVEAWKRVARGRCVLLQGACGGDETVVGGLGRRDASVSGDYNPIHLADVTARPFGFRKAIAHGMWSLARCAAELGEAGMPGQTTLDVAFRLPVYLPAWVTLESCAATGTVDFALKDSAGHKPYLTGELRTTSA